MATAKQKHKLIFSIGDDGCIITCMSGKTLVKRVFAVNPFAPEFEDITKNYQNAEIYMLLDNIDQSYNVALIPPVGAGYRKKIINRKIASEFDKNDINHYLSLGREENQRKDWKYLFISVRNAPPVSDWLDALLELPNKFMGIYLLPLEAANFIKLLKDAPIKQKKKSKKNAEISSDKLVRWEVLISHDRVGGIRQIVLKDGAFIFTRISQLNFGLQESQAVAQSIMQEARNTLEYIRRIGFNDDENLNVYFITSKDVSKGLEELQTNSINVILHTPFTAAQKLNLPNIAQENDKYADVLLAAVFATAKAQELKLSTPKVDKINNIISAITALKGLSILLSSAFVLLGAYFIYDIFNIKSEKSQIETQISNLKNQLNNTKDFEKEFGISPTNVIDIIKVQTDNDKNDNKFFELLKKIADLKLNKGKVGKISYTKTDSSYTIVMDYVLAAKEFKDVSEQLVESDKFAKDFKEGLAGYEVKITGLLSEKKEFKVDAGAKPQIEDLKLNITITGK